MEPIEIEVWSGKESVAEAEALTRRRYYWVRSTFAAGYRVYLLAPAVYVGFLGARGLIYYTFGRTLTWKYALLCAILVTVPFVLVAIMVRGLRREIRSRKADYGRVQFTFSECGISGIDDLGRTFHDMWAEYSGFHVGRHVIVCPKAGSLAYLRIPTDELTASRRSEIISLLSRHLAELTASGVPSTVWRRR